MKPLFSFLLACISISASAQVNTKLLHYDSSWKPTKLKSAYYHVEQLKYSDTCYEWNYYVAGRPRWMSMQFKDEKGRLLHGKYVSYRPNGFADTVGYYKDGKRDGEWLVYASNTRRLKTLLYADDGLIWEKDSITMNKEMELRANASQAGSDGKTFTKVEIESEFPGGSKAWQTYLGKNLRYPEESVKRHAQGMVIVQFIVDKEGKVTASEIYRSVEYFIDKEALRMIAGSPDWTPAVQNGRKVKSYKKQPIGFKLQ